MSNKTLQKILTTGLTASEDDVRAFAFDHLDLAVAQYQLDPPRNDQGNLVPMHTALDVPESTLRQRLLDPVRCAWVSAAIREAVGQRLGNIIAAVYAHGVRTGDPGRARFLLEVYEKARPKEVHHKHVHMDLTQLTDEELRTFIADRRRVVDGETVVLPSSVGQGEAENRQPPD